MRRNYKFAAVPDAWLASSQSKAIHLWAWLDLQARRNIKITSMRHIARQMHWGAATVLRTTTWMRQAGWIDDKFIPIYPQEDEDHSNRTDDSKNN